MNSRFRNVTLALLAATIMTASRANATAITFTLNQSGTGPVGTAGTITINDVIDGANTVDVLVTLNAGYGFVKTGAGDALAFNITGHPSIGIGDITSGFEVGPTNVNESPFGTFNYAVSCTTGCGNGGSDPNHGPLSFDVILTGVTVDQFVGNNLGYFFASDLIGPGPTGAARTGNMAAFRPVTSTDVAAVPEPASLTLLGTGLVCVARRVRRR